MSRTSRLLEVYEKHLASPWNPEAHGALKVVFALYSPDLEGEIRHDLPEFEQATLRAGLKWTAVDLTDSFPTWLAGHEYRDAYFECPDDLGGYQNGHLPEFSDALVETIKKALDESTAESVVTLVGVGTLFGFARISEVVRSCEPHIKGRLLVFFPGTFQDNSYKIYNARDGWNYRAVPLTA